MIAMQVTDSAQFDTWSSAVWSLGWFSQVHAWLQPA